MKLYIKLYIKYLSFNYEIQIHLNSTLIMVRIQTESTRLTINGSFEEIISAFQDHNIKRNIRTLERKKKNFQNNKDYILFNQTGLNEKMQPKYTFS